MWKPSAKPDISQRGSFIALDVAATELYKDGKYHFSSTGQSLTETIAFYEKLTANYPVISIEDGWMRMTGRAGRS